MKKRKNMKKKICIIGGGIFGVSIYIRLKQSGYDCHLVESKKNLLAGATTNNLNRLHFGYHYPRNLETAKQSKDGYKSFSKFYSNSIIKNFPNYYFIANKSKVNLKKYIEFCKKCKLDFELLDLKKFPISLNNIEGGIKVKEPIYDWHKLKIDVGNKIKSLKNNKVSLGTKVLNIKKIENKFILRTNKKKLIFADIIVDTSYNNSNTLTKTISTNRKFKYQLTFVSQFKIEKFKKLGIAIMDGNFFSFLPKGKSNNHLFYHVKHSIIKENISDEFNKDWLKITKNNKKIKNSKKMMCLDFKKYFPKLKFKFSEKIFISPRLIQANVEKTDKRPSEIRVVKKNYFKIVSGKVDHCIDLSEKLKKIFKKNNI